jgi:hypothetical protein
VAAVANKQLYALLDEAILRCVGGEVDRLSSYRENMTPSKEAVRGTLEKLTLAFESRGKWPTTRTIQKRILELKRKSQGRQGPGMAA